MGPEYSENYVESREVNKSTPITRGVMNLTFREKLNLASKVIIDTALPVRGMYEPIDNYPQRTRAEVRIIRTLGGIGLHSVFVIVGIEHHEYLVLGVNALALAGITPRYLMEPRRIKQLIPRFIRKR